MSRFGFIKLFVVFIGAFVFIPCVCFGAMGLSVEGAVGIWNHAPSGLIQYKDNQQIEINGDLGLGNRNDWQFWLRIEHSFPLLPDLKLMYSPIQVEDQSNAKRNISFYEVPFSMNNPMNTKLEMDIFDATVYYHLPLLQTASVSMVDISGGMTFRFLDGQAVLESVRYGDRASKSFKTPLGLFYGGLRLSPSESLALIGDASVMKYAGHHWYDFTGKVQLTPESKLVLIGIGYRYMDMKLDNLKDITADQIMQGWFGELGFKF